MVFYRKGRCIELDFENMDYVPCRLFQLRDEVYQAFHSKLIPNVDSRLVIGVRMPVLRAFAGEFAKTSRAGAFMTKLPHTYYEENNLHALLINELSYLEETFRSLDAFLPFVDNWATCDALRPKAFTGHRREILQYIRKWIHSKHAYTIRFGIEMLMVHFLDDEFCPEYLELVAGVTETDYYVRMMIAWYFATALFKQYCAAIPYLEGHKLDYWIHNKTIQKAIESHRIAPEQKTYLRTLRVKEKGRIR